MAEYLRMHNDLNFALYSKFDGIEPQDVIEFTSLCYEADYLYYHSKNGPKFDRKMELRWVSLWAKVASDVYKGLDFYQIIFRRNK